MLIMFPDVEHEKPNTRTKMVLKSRSPANTKLITLSFVFLLIIFLIIRTIFQFPSSPQPLFVPSRLSIASRNDPSESPACLTVPVCARNNTPPFLANALVHYATSRITPQQTRMEISVSLGVLLKKSPCNFLVFGLGHDSLMWAALNHGGRTVFLEEDKRWINMIVGKNPSLEAYHAIYDTKLHQAEKLLKVASEDDCKVVTDPRRSKCILAIRSFPNEVYNVEWDMIMVDAPKGYNKRTPGRMTAIYTAGLMARNRERGETDVFVHDVDRVVEDKFSRALLCEGYLTEQEGRLWRFTIPSHRARLGMPFCPV